MVRTGGRAKPQVVLSGFFGRGNCGDEALLQAQYEWLSPCYDIVISVDEDPERLGEELRLPAMHQHLREHLERSLTPLANPRSALAG